MRIGNESVQYFPANYDGRFRLFKKAENPFMMGYDP